VQFHIPPGAASAKQQKWVARLASDGVYAQKKAAATATRRIQRTIARIDTLRDVQLVSLTAFLQFAARFVHLFLVLQQISAIDAVKLEHVQAAAAAAVASRPESQIRVPFGQLLVTLARWKFGLDALTSVERLQREGALAGWVRHMLAARLQCVVRGFLARRARQRDE